MNARLASRLHTVCRMLTKIQWFNSGGSRAGCEYATLAEISQRLSGGKADCTYDREIDGMRLGKPKLVRVYRLMTGEVARVFECC